MGSIQLKDLVPGKKYTVKIRAVYGDDRPPGPWSKVFNFTAPSQSKDDSQLLRIKNGVVIGGTGSEKKRGYIKSATFNGTASIANGVTIADDPGNDNIGTAGWIIDYKGNAVFNNVVARGQIVIDLDGNQGRMYFGENIPAFGSDKADGIKLDAYNYWFRTKSIADKRPSWRVGDADSYVSYNPDSNSANGKLIVRGQIQAGLSTGNQVLLGANVGGAGVAGVKIDDSNFWYDADKVSSGLVFKVSGADTTGITVNKDGRVTLNSDHSDGKIIGNLKIPYFNNKNILIGKNVSGSNDGVFLDANNYWYVSSGDGSTFAFKMGNATKNFSYSSGAITLIGGNISLTQGGVIKTSDANSRIQIDSDGISGYTGGNKKFFIDANGDTDLFEGTVNPTGGVVKGKLTITNVFNGGTSKFEFGKDVLSTRDGIKLNDNNYWTISQTANTANFKVGGDSSFLSWDGSSLTIQIGGSSVATQNQLTLKADASGTAIWSLLANGTGTGVVITSAGQIYSNGKTSYNSSTAGWYLGQDTVGGVSKYTFGIGDSNSFLRWDGSSLSVKGSITGSTFTGGLFRTNTSGNRVQMIDTNSDQVQFWSEYTDNSPANIKILTSFDSNSYSKYYRTLQISSTTMSPVGTSLGSWMDPVSISLTTGFVSTASSQSTIQMSTPRLIITNGGVVNSHETIISGSLTVQGNLTVNGTGGGGSSYQAGYGIAIDTSTTPSTINNSGYRMNGSTTSPSGSRSSTQNRITFGDIATVPNGKSDGDIHIEF